jgi:hypothetical protein
MKRIRLNTSNAVAAQTGLVFEVFWAAIRRNCRRLAKMQSAFLHTACTFTQHSACTRGLYTWACTPRPVQIRQSQLDRNGPVQIRQSQLDRNGPVQILSITTGSKWTCTNPSITTGSKWTCTNPSITTGSKWTCTNPVNHNWIEMDLYKSCQSQLDRNGPVQILSITTGSN